MPFKKTNVVVEGLAFVPPDPGDHPDHGLPGDQPHPEHPIYLPVPTPPDLGIWGPTDPRPTPPIYIPIQPPDLGIWGPTDPRPSPPIYIPVPRPPDSGGGEPPSDAHPEHPIYWPVEIWGPTDPRPTPPIELPPWVDIDDDQKEKLKDFLLGNLPPSETPPPQPVPN